MHFQKILILNRGEIAVRIARTCRELGIPSIALFRPGEKGSLHMRLADECVLLDTPAGYLDQQAVFKIAREKGAEAIHPGYGLLAERPDFIQACESQGITFIGPPAEVVFQTMHKIVALERAHTAGFPTVEYSPYPLGREELSDPGKLTFWIAEAERLGYPVVVKALEGGRGSGERLVRRPEKLAEAFDCVLNGLSPVYTDRRVYLEKAVLPGYQVGVPVLRDSRCRVIPLAEHQGLARWDNRKMIEESPAPCLEPAVRQQLLECAGEITQHFQYQNIGTVEFIIDREGKFYFTEIKASLRPEHPLTEMAARVDLVSEQIRIAEGAPLLYDAEELRAWGWAALCRIYMDGALDGPCAGSPRVQLVHVPGGPHVRMDTSLPENEQVSEEQDPLIAKLVAWGENRPACVQRLRRSLEEARFLGLATNQEHLLHTLDSPEFTSGSYGNLYSANSSARNGKEESHLRNLAAAAAVLYVLHSQQFCPEPPGRFLNRRHRDLRIPPRWIYSGLNHGQVHRYN